MIELVKVISAQPLGGYIVQIAFSTGEGGVRDFSDIVAEGGPMVAPLANASYFARVFVQSGALAWPNGFDLDAIALHQEMSAAGLLQRQPHAVG